MKDTTATKWTFFLLGLTVLGLIGAVAPGKKISEYPNTATLDGTELMLLAVTNTAIPTNKNIKTADVPVALGITAGMSALSNQNTATSNRFQSIGIGSYTNQEFSIVFLSDNQPSITNDVAPFPPTIPDYTNVWFEKTLNDTRDWITSRIASHNIKAVVFSGDLVDHPSASVWPTFDCYVFWTNSWMMFSNLLYYPVASKIPFLMIPGNHDTDNDSLETYPKQLAKWNTIFGTNLFYSYPWWNGRMFPTANNPADFYCDIDTAPIPLTVVGLVPGAHTSEYSWATDVMNARSNRFGIFLTHSWLTCLASNSGEVYQTRRLDARDSLVYGTNSAIGLVAPEQAWQKYVRYWPGLNMVLCGHAFPGAYFSEELPTMSRQQSVGFHGNFVSEIRSDFQYQNAKPDYWAFNLIKFNLAKGEINVESACGTNWNVISTVSKAMTNHPWNYTYRMPINGVDLASGSIKIPGIPMVSNASLYPYIAFNGTSNNWYQYGDNVNKRLVFAANPPTNGSIFSNVTGSVYFDNDGKVTASGGIVAKDYKFSTIQWQDLRLGVASMRVGAAAPVARAFMGAGVRAYAFDKNTDNEVEFEMQLPHGIDTNDLVLPNGLAFHLHWSATNAPGTGPNSGLSNVVWGLEYTFASVGGVYGATTTLYATNRINTNWHHILSEFHHITNVVKESAVFVGRLFRDADNASDEFPDDAYALSIDIHYPLRRFGSTNELGDY